MKKSLKKKSKLLASQSLKENEGKDKTIEESTVKLKNKTGIAPKSLKKTKTLESNLKQSQKLRKSGTSALKRLRENSESSNISYDESSEVINNPAESTFKDPHCLASHKLPEIS